ncbi:MAG: PAS domain-containing protein, partial [Burkholderiaceae bacterium]|nr:PAS domain-containing protein [Burkholderiaceae bacterium]
MISAQPVVWWNGLLEAVWHVDEKSLCILDANAAAARLLGLSVSEMRGLSVLRLAATPQEQAFWSEPAEVLERGVHAHSRLLRADGTLVSVERQVTRVQQPNGQTVLLLV